MKLMSTNDEQNLEAFRRLRELCGYVENGGHTSVNLGQDDATRDWVLTVGQDTPSQRKRVFYGSSMGAAIAAAYAHFGDAT